MSGVCARYADYLRALEAEETFTVLNPQKVAPTANGCPQQLRKEMQRIAYGFKKLLAEVPKNISTTCIASSPITASRVTTVADVGFMA